MQAPSVLELPDKVALFVYGTMRPGGVLFQQWLADVTIDHEPGLAVDHSLWQQPGGWFPFMRRERGQRTTGDVLWVQRSPALARMVRMEQEAGYSFDVINVETESLSIPQPVLAFTWHRHMAGMKRVRFNDWNAA